MKITELHLSGFRNLSDLTLRPSGEINVFYGDNAQGKTNLLESIWLFTGSKSFRGSKDGDLVRFGSNLCRIHVDYASGGRECRATIDIGQSRKAELNGVPLDCAARLAGEFCAVIFSPEHLGLIKDGPQIRRKFIDAAICQLWPKYIGLIMNYNRALAHRNALLKDIPLHSELIDTLPIWNEKLAHTGSHIVMTRLRYLKMLRTDAQNIYNGISHGSEKFDLIYQDSRQQDYMDSGENQAETAGILQSTLLKNLETHRKQDIECGYTHDGPHKDDLLIKINGLHARLFGSQGQQRSAALALKLAEASVLQKQTGESPILLLDDVMSELDRSRQDYLLRNIMGWQVFITCCDPSAFSRFEKGKIFQVEKGNVTEIDRLSAVS